jgi:hypothetical protein
MSEAYLENYKKYRGKCKEYCEAACAADPTLTMVRAVDMNAVEDYYEIDPRQPETYKKIFEDIT